MSMSHLGFVKANGRAYHHVIDTENDSVYLRDWKENVLMEIDHSGNVIVEDKTIARWRLSDNRTWKLVDLNNEVIYNSQLTYLIDAEMGYSKEYITDLENK